MFNFSLSTAQNLFFPSSLLHKEITFPLSTSNKLKGVRVISEEIEFVMAGSEIRYRIVIT